MTRTIQNDRGCHAKVNSKPGMGRGVVFFWQIRTFRSTTGHKNGQSNHRQLCFQCRPTLHLLPFIVKINSGDFTKDHPRLRSALFTVRVPGLCKAHLPKLFALIWVLFSTPLQHGSRQLVRNAYCNILRRLGRNSIGEFAQRYRVCVFGKAPTLPGLCVIQSNVDANAGRVLLISGKSVGFPNGHDILSADNCSVFFQCARPGCFRVRLAGPDRHRNSRCTHCAWKCVVQRCAHRLACISSWIGCSRTQHSNLVDFLFEIAVKCINQHWAYFFFWRRIRG